MSDQTLTRNLVLEWAAKKRPAPAKQPTRARKVAPPVPTAHSQEDSRQKRAPLEPSHIERLYQAGLHAVLLDRDTKKPIWHGWPDRRPGIKAILAHQGGLGLIPSSLDFTVTDVDQGDCTDFTRKHPPACQSLTPSGVHLFYGDTEPRKRRKFAVPEFGISGDIISARSYVKEHDPARSAAMLCEALEYRGQQLCLFPDAELTLPTAEREPEQLLCSTVGHWVVRSAKAGLFNRLSDAELGAYVLDRAEAFNRDIGADPDTVRRVSFRHANKHAAKRAAFRARQSAKGKLSRGGAQLRESIALHLGEGRMTQSEIAAAVGVHVSYVKRIAARLKLPGKPSKPWEAAGVSRATWYRRRETKVHLT